MKNRAFFCSDAALGDLAFYVENRSAILVVYDCETHRIGSFLQTVLCGTLAVQVIRRYWGAVLILMLVAAHAGVIGYVRSRVARLSDVETTAFELGDFRFQTLENPKTVYHFQLHAVIDPAKIHRGRKRLTQMKMEIREASEQLLRQSEPQWLNDPAQTEIRERLMEIVHSHLDEPLVQRVMITDWLNLPVGNATL